jgi:rhodanese-related sulfurtransferase
MTDDIFRKAAAHADGFRDADPLLLEQYLAHVHVVDVREPPEFGGELGHIAGAHLVPLATIPAEARTWDPDKPLALVCRSGGRSGSAARQLVQMGFRKVVNLRGGMIAWNAAGRPIVRTAAVPNDALRPAAPANARGERS